MADRLVLPVGASLTTKDRSGLFAGAVVILRGLSGLSGNQPGLVLRVYDDDEMTTAADGKLYPWTGSRPFIDAVCVREVRTDDAGAAEFTQFLVRKIPHEADVRAENKKANMSPLMVTIAPRYVIVNKLEGR